MTEATKEDPVLSDVWESRWQVLQDIFDKKNRRIAELEAENQRLRWQLTVAFERGRMVGQRTAEHQELAY